MRIRRGAGRGERSGGEGGGAAKTPVSWTSVWQEAREIVWARRGRLALGLVLLVVGRLAGMVLPASTKFLIDEVILGRRPELLLPIGLAAGAGTLIQAGTSFALTLVLGITAQRSITELRRRVQSHVERLPVRFFEENKSGELISRVLHDADGVRNLVGSGFVQMVGGLISSAVAIAVLLWLNWRLTLLAVFFIALLGVVLLGGLRRLRPLFRERSQLMAELSGRLAESIGGIRVVKAYTAEKREARIFAGGAHRLLRNVVRSMLGVSTVNAASSLLFGLIGIGMSVFGAREVLAGRMSVGDLLMFAAFVGLMVSPLAQAASVGTQMTEALAGLDRIREVLSEEPEWSPEPGRQPRLPRLAGDLELEEVEFAYQPGEPVLHGISFRAPAGSTTALVGPSGAGKSTVISLVLGFRRPQSGTIRVDGRDLAELPLAAYREQLAVVLQDDFLFDGTIAANIRYGRSGASREEIEGAGRLAGCAPFVEEFEDGWDTVIGERGVKLSGGQRQRVTIARAILADPRILILDEATSSLDSESEEWIQRGLATLRRGRTTLVIAHRLSTIRNADQILVLDRGRIVERGAHDELMAAGGRYRTLVEKQMRVEEDRYLNPGEEPGDDARPRARTDERSDDEAEALPVGRTGLVDL